MSRLAGVVFFLAFSRPITGCSASSIWCSSCPRRSADAGPHARDACRRRRRERWYEPSSSPRQLDCAGVAVVLAASAACSSTSSSSASSRHRTSSPTRITSSSARSAPRPQRACRTGSGWCCRGSFPNTCPVPAAMRRSAYWPSDGHEMPIGFSKVTIGFPRVGINCAMCHTASYRLRPDDPPTIIRRRRRIRRPSSSPRRRPALRCRRRGAGLLAGSPSAARPDPGPRRRSPQRRVLLRRWRRSELPATGG